MSTPRADAVSAGEPEGGLVAERRELKYWIAPDRVHPFVGAMNAQLPRHRFKGDGANTLPEPQHFVTTVYFDTASRKQYQAALDDDAHSMKLRAKEYYDVHASLAELATDPRQLVRFQPVLWLELKFRDDTTTGKRRIGIPKMDVPAFFNEGRVTPEMIELQRPLYGASGERVLREVAAYCGRLGEPLAADCLVNYRRVPWQDAGERLRVTLDLGLEFYAPPADLWERRYALVRGSLGPPRGRAPHAIVEVKSRGESVPWLDRLLEDVGAEPASASKFLAASRAVHGA